MYNNHLIKIFTFIISYFAPISSIVHVMLIFILVDCLSAIWAAKKNNIPIESRKMRKTVIKMFWYLSAVLMAHMMEKEFNIQFAHMAQIVAGFVCMVEMKSVFENITKITNEPVFIKIYKIFEKKAKDSINLNDDEK